MNTRTNQLIGLGVFFVIVGIFFWPIFGGKIPVPSDALVGLYHPWRDALAQQFPRGVPFRNFLITDPVRQQIPWRMESIAAWKQGERPGWNPYDFSGVSLAGNIQAAAWYPLNIIFFIFPPWLAWTVLIVSQSLMSGLFMYWYLLRRQYIPQSALFGALVWAFCGVQIAWLTWGTIGHVLALLPLTLIGIDVLLAASAPLWQGISIITVSWCLGFLAGHAQVFLYSMTLSIAYGITQAQKNYGIRKKFLLGICIAGGLFLLATWVLWWPFIQVLMGSLRASDTLAWQKAGWFIPIEHLLQFIVPDFFGNPATLNYWGQWNYGEFIGYIGILPLIFFVEAIVHRPTKTTRFWFLILITASILAIASPIASIPYILHIPIFSTMQPTRLLVVIDFALTMLSVISFAEWKKQNKPFPVWGIGVIGGIITVLWILVLGKNSLSIPAELIDHLAIARQNLLFPTIIFIASVVGFAGFAVVKDSRLGKISLSIIGVFIILLTSVDLLRFATKFTPFVSKDYFFPSTATIKFLRSYPQPFRIMSVDDRILPPNVAGYYQLESASGYDPVIPSRYEEFIAASERDEPNVDGPFGFNRLVTPKNLVSPLVPLLNVKYILSLSDISLPFMKKVFQEGETRVYEDARYIPRFFFANSVIAANNKKEVMQKMFAADFAPDQMAITEGSTAKLITAPGSVSIVNYSPSTVTLATTALQNGFLVALMPFDIHWVALVDGKKTPIIRTDYLFSGIVVPSGSHQVVMRYIL